MLLREKRFLSSAFIACLLIAMVMMFGITAQADAAEYKSVGYIGLNKATTCNGVEFSSSYESMDNGTKDVYRFGDYKVEILHPSDWNEPNQNLNSVFTNGSYVYYAVGKFSNSSTSTTIYKMNLSTGSKTKVKTFSNNNNIWIAGVYGKRIYYLTNKGSAKNDNGALKCYKTDTKKTTTINSAVTAVYDNNVRFGNGRYIYMWINSSGYLKVYDTHTAKLVRTMKTWPSGTYGMSIAGMTSTKVVLRPFNNNVTNVYRIDNSGANKTTLVSDIGGGGVKDGYLYYSKNGNYYKMKISDKTKTTITEDEYWSVYE